MRILSILCGLNFAVLAGFFFAFSVAVMPGLQAAPGAAGMVAMQSLNRFEAHPIFAACFWGAIVLAVISAVLALISRCEGWRPLLAGCMLFLLGGMLITLIGNTPLSNELAALSPLSAHGMGAWPDYLRNWSLLNQMRTVLCLVAAGCALTPLMRMPMSYWRVAG